MMAFSCQLNSVVNVRHFTEEATEPKEEEKKKKSGEVPMEVEGDDEYTVMNDPAFLQSVLESLPGVDPQSEAVRQAVGSFAKDKEKEKDKDKKQGQDKDKK